MEKGAVSLLRNMRNKVLKELLAGGRLLLLLSANVENAEGHCKDVKNDMEVYADDLGNPFDYGFDLGKT